MSVDSPLALFLACLVSGLFVPFPEEVALLVAGWRIRTGELDPALAVAAGTLGTLGRDLIAFGLGSVLGPRLERMPRVRRLLGEARLARAHALFEGHGRSMLFFTRFLMGLRAPLYWVGGSLAFPVRRFVALDLIGLAITVPATLWTGYTFGEGAEAGLHAALAHQRAVLVGAVLLVGAWWLGRTRRGAAGG